MARRGPDKTLLFISAFAVLVAFGVAIGGTWHCLATHPSAQRPVEPEPPDAAPLEIPELIGPRCGGEVVRFVRQHASKESGITVETALQKRLEAAAKAKGTSLFILGWRGREDYEKRDYCRVSMRYQMGDERGASVWLVHPDSSPEPALEPQGRQSIESTGEGRWPDQATRRAMKRKCVNDGIDRVKRHFSYKENYSIWRCLRKRAGEVRRHTGVEITYDRWSALAEGPNRCLLSVTYTEDEIRSRAYYRLRYLPNKEYEVVPLTPRAIESILGPNIFSR